MLFFEENEARDFYYGKTCGRGHPESAALYSNIRSGDMNKFEIHKDSINEVPEVTTIPDELPYEGSVLLPMITQSDKYIRNLPQKIRSARNSLGLTQKQAADIIGVSESSYQKAEYGEVSPIRENLHKYKDFIELEKLFKKSLDQVLLRKTVLTMSSRLFGGKSAVEFGRQLFPDGLRVILATFRRSYE